MKSIIRWQGLVAFFVVAGLITAISVLFMDTWIKWAAQSGLEKATGAEVNIDSVEHSFSPFGITLTHIQLTDPNAPETNQVEAQTLSAKIALSPLLLRKLIIDELTITGAQFGTPREKTGEVFLKPEDQQDESGEFLSEMGSNLSVDDILAKSPLKTTKAIEDTQAVYAKHSETLQQQYQNLPAKEKLVEYKERIKQLTDSNYEDPIKLAAAKKQFDTLVAEIKQDRETIGQFKQSITLAKNELSPQLATLKAAPGQDYQQLKAFVAGDADAIGDVTTLVFGEKAGQWSQYVLAALDIVGLVLLNQKEKEQQHTAEQGRWISFDDTSGLPDLWIKQATVSVQWQQEQIISDWQDITHQHDVLGRPTVFSVNSTSSSLWQSLKLNGDLWLGDAWAKAQQNWDLVGLKITDTPLLEKDLLTSKLVSWLVSSNGTVRLTNGLLDGDSVINLAELAIEATGSNKMTNIVADTLDQLKQLKIDAGIGGAIGDMDLSFSSDLNTQLGSALLSNVSAEQQAKLDELKHKLNQQTAGLLGESDGQLSQWLEWEQLADGNLDSLNELLAAKMNSLVDQQKDKLKDKLFDKLKN